MYVMMDTKSSLSKISTDIKVKSIEESIEKALSEIQGLVIDYEDLKLQKSKCEKKTCASSIELINEVHTKNNIIQSIASALTKLNESKDWNMIHGIFRIICGETTLPVTPPQDQCVENNKLVENGTAEQNEKNETSEHNDNFINNDSASEIEGTPTGRKSPIISSNVYRNSPNLQGSRDKKKCSEYWPTPEKKQAKIMYSTPTRTKTTGRLSQARLNLVKVKSTSVVDLTNSLEIKKENMSDESKEQLNIKQEELDDETILPSPSGLLSFQSLQKSLKSSPGKFKRPLSTLKKYKENRKVQQNENAFGEDDLKVFGPTVKIEKISEDTYKEFDESMSLLQQLHHGHKPETVEEGGSPSKRPLAENVNGLNVGTVLRAAGDRPVKVAPVYKEPVVRKKSEKKALPGWSCEECRNFYDELYNDNTEMLAKKMDECSKHRGRNNPVRPRTPPGFWNPRWDVADDTEEFNRRNNAL